MTALPVSSPAIVAWFTANPDFDPADPPEEAYAALVQDLARMQVEKTTGHRGHADQLFGPGLDLDVQGRARAPPRT